MKNDAAAKEFLGITKSGAIALAVFIVIALLAFSFIPPPTAKAPQTHPVVLGTFSGTLPCADCGGLQETLTLTQKDADTAEGTYTLTSDYMDKGTFSAEGEWTTLRGDATDENAVVYELDPDTDHPSYYLKVDEASIRQLSGDMKEIDSPFDQTLRKSTAADAWVATPLQSLAKALMNQPVALAPNTLDFSMAVDLTGDTVPEGLFITWKGATGVSSTIFSMNASREPVALMVKDKDGKVSVAALTDARSATYSAQYALLPSAHGYYTYTESNKSTDPKNPSVSCDPDSFGAYVWNKAANEFEWNAALTNSYKAQRCR